MPAYLIHGFRWPRAGFTGIRVHAIVHNLEDCSVEYIQNAGSRTAILQSFREIYPELMRDIEGGVEGGGGRTLEFIEQYDPLNEEGENAVSQPHAYVADQVVELPGGRGSGGGGDGNVKKGEGSTATTAAVAATSVLSINVEEVIADGPGLTARAWMALAELRDKIAAGEKIGWWVVYNGDPERAYDSYSDRSEDESDYDDEGESANGDEHDHGDANQPGRLATPTPRPLPAGTAHSPHQQPQQPQRQTTPYPLTQIHGPPLPPPPPVPPKSKESPSSPPPPLPMPPSPNTHRLTTIHTRPETVLSAPKDDVIPEPARARDVAKAGGFRKRFFGKKT